VPSLQPGNYSVSVHAAGFAEYKLASVTLQVDQNVTANVKLGVASAGQVVQVQSVAPLIDAQTSTVGQVIDQTTVQKIPLKSTFGQITATRTAIGDAGSSRQLQFAMRFQF
jgi:hypothetical protein